MKTIEFLQYRASFAGIPFGELQTVMSSVQMGEDWMESCCQIARGLRKVAEQSELAGRKVSAAQTWRWAASTYHIASFGFHIEPGRFSLKKVIKLRHLARLAYLRAIQNEPQKISSVSIPCNGAFINGYLRRPTAAKTPLIVLLNGLDSMCEVELHTFGTWLLERNLAVLAVDLPSSFSTKPRKPRFDMENLAASIADWAESQSFEAGKLGAFGVSFGGHLVARLMAGDSRFRSGVAVSPSAWISQRELQVERLRGMFAWSFALQTLTEIDNLSSLIRLEGLPKPQGNLLILQMEKDELFGQEHINAFQNWGEERVSIRRRRAEHVGTSQIHYWLPEVCDWLQEGLST
ncbi:MAG TPA: alpha/beta hydrolase [Pyrinomonadaceae bacterium]|jgi:dienelactone hydrolase